MKNKCVTFSEVAKKSNVYSEDYGAMSAREIADALGISKRRVNQLLKSALTKLKNQVTIVYGDIDVDHFLL